MELTPFKNLIRERCGLLFGDEKAATLSAGIRSRMSSTELKCHTEYFNHLFSDQDEFLCLVSLLTVNETYFFREPPYYRLLSEKLIPELLRERKQGSKINILSAGCSTGEEAYSIAMALLKKYGLGSQNLFSIIATDINREALRIAKKGVFTKKSFRGLDGDLKNKFFEKIGIDTFEVITIIKNMVEFQNVNLLSSFYPGFLNEKDIIFYRNVSIYFDRDTQRKVFRKLSHILNEKGYLFVSSTETFFHNIGILSLIERDGLFLYQKNLDIKVDERRKTPKKIADIGLQNMNLKTQILLSKPQVRNRATRNLKKSSDQRRKDSRELFDEALHLAKSKKHEEALNSLNKLFSEYTGFIKAYTLKVSVLINLHRLEEAKEICLKTIEMDQWNLEGYLLLGLIAKIDNNDDETVKRFKEALYMQPSCWLAHFYLAEVYNSMNELNQAYREYRIVLNLLDKGSLSDHGLTYFPLSFPAEQLIHLCRHNINQLRKRLE